MIPLLSGTYDSGMLDITGAEIVDLDVREDGKVIWVNVDGICRLRICKISGEVNVTDRRVRQTDS